MYKILLLSLFFINIIVCEERPPVKQTDERTILGLYQLMKDVHEVFTAKQITYWIDSGTLLGAVRHGGIIPWDNDIDVCIDITDSDLFLEQIDLFEKLNITYDQYSWGYKLRLNGQELDVFFTMRVNDKIIYWAPNVQEYYATRDEGPVYLYSRRTVSIKGISLWRIISYGPQ